MDPFEPECSGKDAFACAVTSRLAYLEGPALAQDSHASGYELVAVVSRAANFAAILDAPGTRIIAFRGTDQLVDWRANLNVLSTKTVWGRVHRGFHNAVESFSLEVSRVAREAAANGRRVWLTGHSLGGAMAMLATARLLMEHPQLPIAGVHTFGQPPVGSSSFCAHFDRVIAGRYVRFVNHTDAVSDVPMLFRVHSGRRLYFDVDGHLHRQVTFRRNLLDHVLAPARFGGLSQFTAHAMSRYVDLLKSVLDAAPPVDPVSLPMPDITKELP